MASWKENSLRLLRLPGAERLATALSRGRATVFMLHRVADPERGVVGHDRADLRAALEHLRRRRYHLLPLAEVFRRLRGEGPRLERAVAFTLDDGYEDQATLASELFAEFDCPATTFVATGVLDRQLWFWWDRIEYAFRHAKASAIELQVGDETVRHAWADPHERLVAQIAFTERCKEVADEEKHEAIDRLASLLEVALPKNAPPEYAPMTWDQLRAAEERGMRFGPHTVTHPILARTSDEQSRFELAESWNRLRCEARSPEPIFCYPNGQPGDFGAREFDTLEALGLEGAVVGSAGYADRDSLARENGRFQMRRFHLPGDLLHVIQLASGLEALKDRLRGRTA